jgi:putative transposase
VIEQYPEINWQRCVVQFHSNVFSCVPNSKVADVVRTLNAIHA